MDEHTSVTDDPQATDDPHAPDRAFGGEQPDDTVGADEPVGRDNIRDGTVRGTMHGGPTKSEGQGQGG